MKFGQRLYRQNNGLGCKNLRVRGFESAGWWAFFLLLSFLTSYKVVEYPKSGPLKDLYYL